MQRSSAVLGSTIFFLAVPSVLAGVIPWWITHWRFQPAFLGLEWLRIVGALLIVSGVPGLVDFLIRFAVQGLAHRHRSLRHGI